MAEYHFICEIDDLNESQGKRYFVNDTDVAVFVVKNKIFVVSNICPHQKAPSIYEGFIEDDSVICPLHGWKFKLCDGKMDNGSRRLETFDVKIENGKVYAKVYPKRYNW